MARKGKTQKRTGLKPAAKSSPKKSATAAASPKKRNAVKIPAFKYSLRNKSKAAYKDRAEVLSKKYGVPFGFSVSKKLTPARKGAVTKARKKFAQFLNPANGFEFVPASKKKIAAAIRAGTITKAQATAKGIFLQTPDTREAGKTGGSKLGKAAIRIRKDGTIRQERGKFWTETKVFKAADVVTNPELIAAEAKRRGAESVLISIRGARGKTRYDIAQFMRYMTKGSGDKPAFVSVLTEHTESGEGAFQNFFAVEYSGYNWEDEDDEDESEE